MKEKRYECFKALQCLYIATDADVAISVNDKVQAYIYELERLLQEHQINGNISETHREDK